MRISQSNIFDFLNKRVQKGNIISPFFVIPIYQRPYQWNIENSRILIEDLIETGAKGARATHFTGMMLIEKINEDSGSVTYDIIDGQQRLITFALLIKCILLRSKEFELTAEDKAQFEYFLGVGISKRIEPGDKDKANFFRILNMNTFVTTVDSSEADIYKNFEMIYSMLDTEEKFRHAVSGLRKMTIVVLEVEKDKQDDAQEIFERMNSTGKSLSNSDLIRNYLIMGASSQQNRTARYNLWLNIEKNVSSSDDSKINGKNLEKFFFDFVRMKKETKVNEAKIYYGFREYSEEDASVKHLSYEEEKEDLLMNELSEYSRYYRDFIGDDKNPDDQESYKHQLFELREMGHTTPNPFLMKVYYDFEHVGVPDAKTFGKIVNLINIYLVRRTLTSTPTSSLSNFFVTLYKNVFGSESNQKYKENSKTYYEAVYAFMMRATGRDLMPDDRSVIEQGPNAKVFGNAVAVPLLQAIEFGRFDSVDRKEIYSKLKDPTVEHIMPQNIDNSDEWIEMLGGGNKSKANNIHKMYINTIGNLSLSTREKNSSMSNSSYEEKREILAKYAAGNESFEILNEFALKFDKFTEKEIKLRAEILLKRVCKKYPLDNSVDIDKYSFNDVETLCVNNFGEIDEYFFKSTSPIEYRFLSGVKRVDTYSKMLNEVVGELFEHKKDSLLNVIKNEESKTRLNTLPTISLSNPNDEDYEYLVETFWILKRCQTARLLKFIKTLIEECGEDPNKLVITIRKPNDKKSCLMLSVNEQYKFIREMILKPLSDQKQIIYFESIINKTEDSWPKFTTKKVHEVFPEDGVKRRSDSTKTTEQAFLYFYSKKANNPSIGLIVHNKTTNEKAKEAMNKINEKNYAWPVFVAYEFTWDVDEDVENVQARFLETIKNIEKEVKKYK